MDHREIQTEIPTDTITRAAAQIPPPEPTKTPALKTQDALISSQLRQFFPRWGDFWRTHQPKETAGHSINERAQPSADEHTSLSRTKVPLQAVLNVLGLDSAATIRLGPLNRTVQTTIKAVRHRGNSISATHTSLGTNVGLDLTGDNQYFLLGSPLDLLSSFLLLGHSEKSSVKKGITTPASKTQDALIPG